MWEKVPMTWIIEPPPYLHISPLRQLLITHVVDISFGSQKKLEFSRMTFLAPN